MPEPDSSPISRRWKAVAPVKSTIPPLSASEPVLLSPVIFQLTSESSCRLSRSVICPVKIVPFCKRTFTFPPSGTVSLPCKKLPSITRSSTLSDCTSSNSPLPSPADRVEPSRTVMIASAPASTLIAGPLTLATVAPLISTLLSLSLICSAAASCERIEPPMTARLPPLSSAPTEPAPLALTSVLLSSTRPP